MSRDKKEGKKNNNKRNNNDGRSNRRISFAAKDEIIYPHTESYLNDKNYYVPKKKGVTPFRLEAQERIRQLSYNVEVSKRLREMKDKNFHQLVNCGIDLHYQSSSMMLYLYDGLYIYVLSVYFKFFLLLQLPTEKYYYTVLYMCVCCL